MKIKDNVLIKVENDDIVDGTFVIPNHINEIDSYAFEGNHKLKYIIIPNNVIKIGRCAFHICENLEYVKLSDNLKSISDSLFMGCVSLTRIELPVSLMSIHDNAFFYCTSLKNLIIPNTVKEIGSCAFFHCVSLKKLVLSNNLSIIEAETFRDCSSLEKINIPDSITEIREYAFEACTSLKEIKMSQKITKIGGYAFANCIVLEELEIPETINLIIGNSFCNCENLNLNIRTSLFDILDFRPSFIKDCKSVTLYDQILDPQNTILKTRDKLMKSYDEFLDPDNEYKCILNVKKKELKDKIEIELIKNNLCDKKYLDEPEHNKFINNILSKARTKYNQLMGFKMMLEFYINSYIKFVKPDEFKISIINDESMDEILEKLNNYNVLTLQINNFKDISSYGNDLLEYSCYITDVYHKIISRYGNDVFTFKIEQLLGKIHKRNVSLLANKIDKESIRYLKLFSKYKMEQEKEELGNLEKLSQIIKIYITKVNECLNNLLNYNHIYNNLSILLASDNNTIAQVLNDKINSLKNNIAIMVEYYKRVDLMIQSNYIYIPRLEIIQKQLNSINLLENKKVEIKQINESITVLNEVIITDKEKSKNVELSDEVINSLDEEINKITNDEKILVKI